MIHFRPYLLLALTFLLQNCEEKAPTSTRPFNAELMPAEAKPVPVSVYKVNSWVEQGKFNVVGICTNTTAAWQKIWMEVVPVNGSGKPLAISKCSSAIVPTFSDAVPPSGRTSFFASWPLADIAGKPDSCIVKATMAIQPAPGPILVSSVVNGMQMLSPSGPGQPAMEAWQVSSSVNNPLPVEALHPRLEVLIYGADGRLWLSTLLNPEDPAIKPIFRFEGDGPLKPGEDRPFSLQVYYQGLPQIIQQKRIGRVEILPFEARQ